nr:hypothetical protein [Tanacetum cinerariifolium]
MESCDPVGTPMEIKDKLGLDQNETPIDATKYHSIIGALMYLTSSRPDIVHATCLCARYHAKPTEKHLKEVKRIFCYLWGTINMGLWYTKDSGFELTGFLDADYAGCKDTFKSTSEYVSLSACCAQALWMQTQLTDYGFHFNKIPIYCDSKSAIAISCNPSKYVLEILNKYGMESCDHVGTPMEIKDKIDLDQNGTPIDATKYRSMIGALMYLTSSRPDIVHAEKHLKEVKRIFRYLRGTVNTGLWYTKDFGFELIGFSDADYAGCKDTFKSTSGGAQFLGEKL